MTPEKLSEEQIQAEILTLPNWALVPGGKLKRKLRFKDFVDAFGFLTSVAIESEKMGHHPEMLCVYNKIEFVLTTHDVGGLSALDFKLARIIDAKAVSL